MKWTKCNAGEKEGVKLEINKTAGKTARRINIGKNIEPPKEVNKLLVGLGNDIKDKDAFDSKRKFVENGLKTKDFSLLGKLSEHAKLMWEFVQSPDVPWTEKVLPVAALASAMGIKIIPASYAEIESKYVGDGPKNVKRLFSYAAENKALLFIDEADSLLSKRLTNIEHGSEQSLNSMRSQLLIEIEKYSGTVVFATNLAANYDSAFKTRMKSILFKKPDKAHRRDLWQKMLGPPLPLAADLDLDKLSEIEDIVGRDIKNAVVKAAIASAIDNSNVITQQSLIDAINGIIISNKEMDSDVPKPLSETEKKSLGKKIRRKLRTGNYRRVHGGHHGGFA